MKKKTFLSLGLGVLLSAAVALPAFGAIEKADDAERPLDKAEEITITVTADESANRLDRDDNSNIVGTGEEAGTIVGSGETTCIRGVDAAGNEYKSEGCD